MNPYKLIQGLYTPDQIENYRGKYRHESPPHVYALAEEAYRNMVNQLESQWYISIVVFNNFFLVSSLVVNLVLARLKQAN